MEKEFELSPESFFEFLDSKEMDMFYCMYEHEITEGVDGESLNLDDFFIHLKKHMMQKFGYKFSLPVGFNTFVHLLIYFKVAEKRGNVQMWVSNPQKNLIEISADWYNRNVKKGYRYSYEHSSTDFLGYNPNITALRYDSIKNIRQQRIKRWQEKSPITRTCVNILKLLKIISV